MQFFIRVGETRFLLSQFVVRHRQSAVTAMAAIMTSGIPMMRCTRSRYPTDVVSRSVVTPPPGSLTLRTSVGALGEREQRELEASRCGVARSQG